MCVCVGVSKEIKVMIALKKTLDDFVCRGTCVYIKYISYIALNVLICNC